MSVTLQIPTDIVQAMRLPGHKREQQLLVELALTLYAQDILSFGKARELTGLGKQEFGFLLGQRGIQRHYDQDDLKDDLTYARSSGE